MKKTLIQVGKVYEVKAGRNATVVKVKSLNKQTGGWVCVTQSGKDFNVKDAARFIREVVPKKNVTKMTGDKSVNGKKTVAKTERGKGGKPNGRLSGLDAAYRVLAETKRAMKVGEITEIALQKGYCALKGATPDLTISAALQREIKHKGAASRFVKTGLGLYAAR